MKCVRSRGRRMEKDVVKDMKTERWGNKNEKRKMDRHRESEKWSEEDRERLIKRKRCIEL